jgi:mersacidin/lichenicidin family type 2 lantibiotic
VIFLAADVRNGVGHGVWVDEVHRFTGDLGSSSGTRAAAAPHTNTGTTIKGLLMNKQQIIRAWKDPIYRGQLSVADRAALPTHPSDWVELSADELSSVAGAAKPQTTYENWACSLPTPVCRRAGC